MAYKKTLSASPATTDVEQMFFGGEPCSDPWSAVCCHQKAKEVYLQRISELLLWLIIPKEEFANPLLQVFLRDMLVWQVWLPLLHILTQPDYINSTFLALCRDSSLTVESFLAAVAEGPSDAEKVALSECLRSEIECLKKTGITDSHQQRLGALDSLLDSLQQKQLKHQVNRIVSGPFVHISLTAYQLLGLVSVQEGEPGNVEEVQETESSASLLAISTTIPTYSKISNVHTSSVHALE